MQITLREKRVETSDVMTFVFDLTGQSYPYTAGQWAYFELPLLTTADPRGKRRHFTHSASPTESGILQFTTKFRGSGYKETLKNAALGLAINVEDAKGKFTLPANADQPIVFLGGGIGVTPFRAMLRYASDENLPYQIQLFYSAPTPEQIVYRRELEHLPQENPNVHIILTVTDDAVDESWSGERGQIHAAMLKRHINDFANTLFYTCGPPPIVQAMQELLQSLDVPTSQIVVERFSGYN